eukprot:5601678-Pleurochrysis_carterae.AAC.1
MEEQENEKTQAFKVADDMRVVKIVEDLYNATIRAVEEFRHLPVCGAAEEVVSHLTKKPRKTMAAFELLISMSIVEYLHEAFEKGRPPTSERLQNLMRIVASQMRANFQTCLENFPLAPLTDRQEKLVTLRRKSRTKMSKFELLFAMSTLQHFTLAKIPVDGSAITIFSLNVPFMPGSNIIFECCLHAIKCIDYEE